MACLVFNHFCLILAKWLIFLAQAIDYIHLRNSRFLTFVKVFDSNEHLKYIVEIQSESLQCGHGSNTLQQTENYIRAVLTHDESDKGKE